MTVMRATSIGAVGLAAGIVPAVVSAHSGDAGGDAAGRWIRYGFEAAVLAASGALYVAGHRARRRRGAGGVTTVQALAFVGGLVVLAAALAPPVEGLARVSFAAHMTQHLLLVVVAAPMLAFARPLLALAGAGEVGRRLARAAGRVLAALIARPAAVWLLNAGILSLWHVPRLFEAALASAVVHAVEHATLLGAAVLFWAVLVEPPGVRVPALGVVYLFAAALQCGALGALITTSDTVWYPFQAAARRSPLADQHLAGALMWIPASGVYLLAALAVLARSLSTARTRAR